jgi:uncharacterized membrane protein
MPFQFLSSWWDTIRTSLWFVPVICVSIAIALSFILPEIDEQLLEQDSTIPPWVFAGSADGARSILSTVAGSLMTITGVLFSITIVVLQQASSQFTPRVMGNFMRQTGTQLVLGVYIATFLYSLLVLRYVRGEDAQAEEFIPRLSVAMSLILATACLGLLVYFIHHMATAIQAAMVIASVNEEFQEDIEELFPEHIGEPLEEADQPYEEFRQNFVRPPIATVSADSSGFLRSVDDQAMIRQVPNCYSIAILPQIGHFVTRGLPLVEIGGITDLTDQQASGIRSAFVLGRERSRYQDPMFSIRQLVDIALKALSPGINDPTTARNAISMLGDALARLAERSFPERIRIVESDDETDNVVYIWTNRPSFADYVECAFSEIRREAISNVVVTLHLVDTIGAVGHRAPNRIRAEALHRELAEIQGALESAGFRPSDERYVRERIDANRQLLQITN